MKPRSTRALIEIACTKRRRALRSKKLTAVDRTRLSLVSRRPNAFTRAHWPSSRSAFVLKSAVQYSSRMGGAGRDPEGARGRADIDRNTFPNLLNNHETMTGVVRRPTRPLHPGITGLGVLRHPFNRLMCFRLSLTEAGVFETLSTLFPSLRAIIHVRSFLCALPKHFRSVYPHSQPIVAQS